jgi:hypothetical protein
MTKPSDLLGDLMPGPAEPGNSTQEIAIVEREEPQVPSLFLGFGSRAQMVGGLVDFSPAQLKLEAPRLRIVHKKELRDQVGEPGQLRLGKDAWDQVDCTFLLIHPGRLYPEGEGKDTKTVCASSNNKVPHEQVFRPKDGDCFQCAYSKWEEDGAGKRHPPVCQELVNFLGVIPSGEFKPFWFICSKTARKPALQFVQEVQKLLEEGVTWVDQLQVRITTEYQHNGAVSWYTPIFSVTGRGPVNTYAELREQVRGIRYLPRLAVTAEDEEMVVTPDAAASSANVDDIPF